jgi:hypothetical protein
MGLKATGSTQMSMSSSNFMIGSKPTITPKQSMGMRQHKSLISAQMNRFTPAPSMMGQKQVQPTQNPFSNLKVSGLTSLIGKSFNRSSTIMNSGSVPNVLCSEGGVSVSTNGKEYEEFRMGFVR